MPTINRQQLKHKIPKTKTNNQSNKYYNTKLWKMLRHSYMIDHPLCEECLKHGIVKPAVDIHHKKPFLRGTNDVERWELFSDWNNLQALCEECHHAIHKQINTGGL